MGQGGYTFCEWRSVRKENPEFIRAFQSLEQKALGQANTKWYPSKSLSQAFGYMDAKSGEQFGRVPILPAMFNNAAGVRMTGSWRQALTALGHQTLISGAGAGHTIPEDMMLAWIGLAFPNEQQHISEVKWQIGDQKYERVNLEEMAIYDKPALIFEEGIVVDEETAFDLYGFVDGNFLPLSTSLAPPAVGPLYQNIQLLGMALYRVKDKLLNNCGAVII